MWSKEKRREYYFEYRKKNREKILERQKKYNDKNKKEILARMKKHRIDNPEKYIWLAIKSRSKKQGIPFNIEISDIVIPKICPVLGIPIEVNVGKKLANYSASVDKIVPKLGYTKGNIIVVSYRANRIKSDASIEELRRITTFYENITK